MLTVVPALPALLPTVLALLAALLAALLSKLLPILPALLPFLAVVRPIPGPVVVTATAALTGTIALASGSVSTSAVPAPTAPTGLVGATPVSPTHLFLLALSTARHDSSVSCTRFGDRRNPRPARSFRTTEAG